MKTLIFAGILLLTGCATTPRQAAQQPQPDPSVSNYSAEQLNKTGRQTPGGALEEVDPSITVSRGGHN
jgi:starvation-inducible outer membrane lipoprotein